jgi:alpha-1,6-mannosyltransferase
VQADLAPTRVYGMRTGTPPGRWGYSVALRSRGLIAALEEFAPTIVVIHDALAFPGAIAPWASRRGVPVVIMCHSHLADATVGLPRAIGMIATPVLEHLQRRALGVGDCVMVASEATRRRVAPHVRAPIVVSRLGVEATFAHARPDPALRARLAPSGPLLVYAGRLSPEKRVTALPEVLAALPDSYSLAIAGSGISAAALARRARALGVAERVHMLGHLGDREALAELLATADCFVHPNANEPFGLAPLEAASAGCRVVIPKRAGAADVLAPTGALLVADDAPATLAHGVADAMRTARPAARTADVGWPSVFASEWQIYSRLLA